MPTTLTTARKQILSMLDNKYNFDKITQVLNALGTKEPLAYTPKHPEEPHVYRHT